MDAQVPILSLNHHPEPSQRRQKGFGKTRILEILHVSLNTLHNGNFKAFGEAVARAIWAWRPLRGSPWTLKYRSILGAMEKFPKKANFGNLARVTKQPTQRQLRGFWGGGGG